jgi:hypothetical protein
MPPEKKKIIYYGSGTYSMSATTNDQKKVAEDFRGA